MHSKISRYGHFVLLVRQQIEISTYQLLSEFRSYELISKVLVIHAPMQVPHCYGKNALFSSNTTTTTLIWNVDVSVVDSGSLKYSSPPRLSSLLFLEDIIWYPNYSINYDINVVGCIFQTELSSVSMDPIELVQNNVEVKCLMNMWVVLANDAWCISVGTCVVLFMRAS